MKARWLSFFGALTKHVAIFVFATSYCMSRFRPAQMLYNDLSPMENHHVAASLAVLRQDDNNFLSHLSRKVWEGVYKCGRGSCRVWWVGCIWITVC